MNQLTMRQTEVLGFIVSFAAAKGYPPTRVEIARHFKFRSPNAAQDHLAVLARKGYLHVAPGTARGLRVLKYA